MQAKKIFRNIIIAILSITIYNIYAINNTYADDTITITLPSSSVNLPITPSSSGVFNSTDINVQVTTSNTAGYTLSMTAADVNLTRTAAVNGTTPTIPTFTSLSGYTSGTTYSQANFPTGYWGYKLSSDANYSPISSSITIADPDESTANTAISNVITFAAKLDNSKPAGSYTTTLTFTATGKTPPFSGIDSVTYLQEFATLTSAQKTTLLNSMTTNTAYQKRDSRDNNDYYIAKLADGNIWFLDNLRLDLTNSTVKTNLTSATTNATDTSLGYLKNGSGSSPYATAAVAEGMTDDHTKPYISTTYKTTINSDSTKNWGNGSHMYGVLYNYCAASAGSYCYAGGAATGNASEDICPAGWHMPTGNSTGEWGVLRSTINKNTASNSASIQARLSLPLSGYFEDGSAFDQGSSGYWWSSTWNNGYHMYFFYAAAADTDASYRNNRVLGYSMRCLFSAS